MINNFDLIIIKQVGLVLAILIAISFILYYHNKEAKRIMGNFAAVLIILWEEVKEKFGI